MNAQEFQKVMLYFTTAYPNAAITGMTAKVYFEHLKDIPFEIMEKAAVKVVETSRFFPSVAEIREVCFKLEKPECNRNEVDAVALLNDAITKYGRYRYDEAMEYIKKKDDVLFKIVKALGFRNLCDTNCNTYRKEITWLYKTSAEDIRKENQLTGAAMTQIIRLENKIERQKLAMQGDNYNF